MLETERLGLRRLQRGDAQLQFELLNTPRVMEYLGGVKTLAQIEEKHAKTMQCHERDGFGFLFVIEKSSGELVGHCGLKRVDHPLAPNQGEHEIGWLMREDRWRHGYAGEAMRAVIDWAFDAHNAPHLVALTSERNRPSWRFMEKLGMERRTDLDFIDPDFPEMDNPVIQYALGKKQWERQT